MVTCNCCEECEVTVLTTKGWEKCWGAVNCLLTAECAKFYVENIGRSYEEEKV